MTFAKGTGNEDSCNFNSHGTGVGQIVAGGFCNCAIIANSDFLNVFSITTGSGIGRVLLDTVSVVARTQINLYRDNIVIKLRNTDHLCTLYTLTDSGNQHDYRKSHRRHVHYVHRTSTLQQATKHSFPIDCMS